MFALLEKLLIQLSKKSIYMKVKAGLGRQSWRIKHFVTWSICVMGLLPDVVGVPCECDWKLLKAFKSDAQIQI